MSNPIDWSDRSSRQEYSDGTKKHQREDKADRTADYREWRRVLGSPYYVADIDQVELRKRGPGLDGLRPVASLELTRTDSDYHISWDYTENIRKRFVERDAQGLIATELAGLLGVHAWIVLYRHDLTEFWVYNLSRPIYWMHLSRDQYRRWLMMLGTPNEFHSARFTGVEAPLKKPQVLQPN